MRRPALRRSGLDPVGHQAELAASADRPAVLMHFLGELSPDESAALEEAYQRLTRQRTPQAGTGRADAR